MDYTIYLTRPAGERGWRVKLRGRKVEGTTASVGVLNIAERYASPRRALAQVSMIVEYLEAKQNVEATTTVAIRAS
jgi:hypothetical protein